MAALSTIKVRCQRLPVLTDTMEYILTHEKNDEDEARIRQAVVCSTLKMEELGAFEKQVNYPLKKKKRNIPEDTYRQRT